MNSDRSFHPRRNLRLPEFDYSQPGAYFVTIVTQNRKPFFGSISNGEMILNEMGRIIADLWAAIPVHFSNVEPGEFVVMPYHIHGIIVITVGVGHDNEEGTLQETIKGATCVSTISKEPNGPKSGSISAIIGSFKSAATKLFHAIPEHSGERLWQRNFYEHVIKNERDYQAIYNYILANPINWEKDEEFSSDSHGPA